MKLYYSPNSPFVRKVRVTAIEKGVSDRIEEVLSMPMENHPDLHAANPLGKIPALILDDGSVIFDSPVICEYLDTLSPQNPLLPQDFALRLQVRKMEALADGIMDALVARYLEINTRAENERSSKWIGRWENAILRAVKVLEDGKEPLPEGLDAGSIALGAALGYLNLRYPEFGLAAHFPKTASWLLAFEQRPAMKATMPVVS